MAEVLPNVDLDALLDDMRTRELVERVGQAGGTRYRLSAAVIRLAGAPAGPESARRRNRLLQAIQDAGSVSTAEAANLLGIERAAARELLNELAAKGRVRALGNARARRYHTA